MSRKKSKSRQQSIKDSRDRKANRFAGYGRQLELEVERLLEGLQEEGVVTSRVRHLPETPEDAEGKDFTVTRIVKGKEVSRDFGVTISIHSWNRSKGKHPTIPQLCFPIGTKPETIKKRILELFDK